MRGGSNKETHQVASLGSLGVRTTPQPFGVCSAPPSTSGPNIRLPPLRRPYFNLLTKKMMTNFACGVHYYFIYHFSTTFVCSLHWKISTNFISQSHPPQLKILPQTPQHKIEDLRTYLCIYSMIYGIRFQEENIIPHTPPHGQNKTKR